MNKHRKTETSTSRAKNTVATQKANSISQLRLPGFMDFGDDYLLSLERDGYSALTIQSYRYHIRWFYHFLVDNQFPTEIGEITESDVSKYIVARRRNHAQNNSLAVVVSALRAFFGWCQQQDYIESNPVAKIHKPKPDKKTMQIFTTEQVVGMIEAWPARHVMGERNRTILLLLYDTGLRVSELCSLTLAATDLKLREILVEHGKGRKQRLVGMSDKLRGQLYRWVTQYRTVWGAESAYLFTNSKGNQMTIRDVWIMVRRSGKRAGVEGVRLSPHVFRHTFSTGLIADGFSLSDLQAVLGHENIQTTALYLHPHPKAVAERHRKQALGDKLKVKLR